LICLARWYAGESTLCAWKRVERCLPGDEGVTGNLVAGPELISTPRSE